LKQFPEKLFNGYYAASLKQKFTRAYKQAPHCATKKNRDLLEITGDY